MTYDPYHIIAPLLRLPHKLTHWKSPRLVIMVPKGELKCERPS